MPLSCARGGQKLDGILNKFAQRERTRRELELAGFDLGKIEKLLNQRQQSLA